MHGRYERKNPRMAGEGRDERLLESVWDYPSPPAVEASASHAQVIFNGFVVADSRATVRVLLIGTAPTYYFPPSDVRMIYLRPNGVHAHCAHRGRAAFFDVIVGDRTAHSGAWIYRNPLRGFEALTGRIAFNAGRMDACLLNGEPVRSALSEDAGGWVTASILGLSRGYPRHWDRPEDNI